MSRARALLFGAVLLTSTGCEDAAQTADDGGPGAPRPDGEPAEEEPRALASCEYQNAFSQAPECKRYVGEEWSLESARTDCTTGVFGTDGRFSEGDVCSYPAVLGECAIGDGTGFEAELVFPGEDAASCADTRRGCETFARGTFTPGDVCEGVEGGGGTSGSAFVQPYLSCRSPLEGEPPGRGEGGEVCTWTLISAATEEGRRYADYASCEDVRTQRPTYPAPAWGETAPDDPRLDDAAFLAEVAWARAQVEATACVCCHSSELAPDGPSQWFVEAEGIWLDSISDDGLAMMAGLVDSSAFGAFDPADNNGFDRTELGVPTTDVPRMEALLVGEWLRRGYRLEDAETIPPFGGPLVDQREHVPGPCLEGQGVDAEGRLVWTGGDARYLYVLDPSAANPGVPPNLDEPEGTLWLVDVPTEGRPFASGIPLGETSGDMRNRVPASAPLSSGATYHLHVLADVGVPITRCLFVAP